MIIAFRAVGDQTGGAVFDSLGGVSEMAAAPIAQRVEGAIAEQAVELLRISICVAGEIFAVAITEEAMIVVHSMLLLRMDKLPPVRGGSLFVVRGRIR